MRIRKLLAMVFTIAIALTIVGANHTKQKVYAEDEEVTATTEADETEVIPRTGDLIWITDEMVTFYGSDKRFRAELTSKIEYEIYIIGRYDEEYWRVYVPMLNEPERVLLIPVEGYNIEVISHDNLVVGDLDKDLHVDVFDLVLLKQIIIYEHDFNLYDYSDIDALIERSIVRQMADVNSDAMVNIADVVCLQSWLLGRTKSFR